MTFAYAKTRVAEYDRLIAVWRSLNADELSDLGWEADELQRDIDDLQKHRDQLEAAWSIVGQRRPPRKAKPETRAA